MNKSDPLFRFTTNIIEERHPYFKSILDGLTEVQKNERRYWLDPEDLAINSEIFPKEEPK